MSLTNTFRPESIPAFSPPHSAARHSGRAHLGPSRSSPDQGGYVALPPHFPRRLSSGRSRTFGWISPFFVQFLEAHERRDRRDHCVGLVRRQLIDQLRERLNQGSLPGPDVLHAIRAESDEDHTPVVRVGTPLNQARSLQRAHQCGHGWLCDALACGEIGDTARSRLLEGRQRRQGGQAHVPGLPSHRRCKETLQRSTDGDTLASLCPPGSLELRGHALSIDLSI
jgi:hypothetical protein